MFLTREELVELTSRKRHSLQRKWLMDRGYRFEVRADGSPVVLRAEIERVMLGGNTKQPRRVAPRFDLIAGRKKE